LLLGGALLAGLAVGLGALALYVRFAVMSQLPSVETIRELRLQVPLRIYSRDGKLIGEFGAERRAPIKYADLPRPLVDAFLDAEDERFFEHPGVDWQGLVRAALKLAATGEKAQGGSTITMQLARNVFLSSEKTYGRKLKEILLAVRIEDQLSKEQILETYLNKIFLGNRAYGVGAAAQVYFGRDVKDLTLSQIAIIAGLPKAPSRDNPMANPVRAKERRNYVLRRMRELNHISEADFQHALREPIATRLAAAPLDADAHYVAEMVRAEMVLRYGDAAYTDGYIVTTTLDSARQTAANVAVRIGLLGYEERHGWNGAEGKLSAEAIAQLDAPEADKVFAELDARPRLGWLPAAAVLGFGPKALRVRTHDLGIVEIAADDFAWAKLGDKNQLVRGDIVRVWRGAKGWRLGQIPQVQGALVALDPRDGAIQALIGGFDFFAGNYNRALQARRQAGSGFKPFLYSAAMSFGYTPASVFLDAPVVYDGSDLGDSWRPENYDREFRGPMRLREALVQSRNLVSVRVLQAIGLDYAAEFATRFGLPRERLPKDLTLALGSAAFTPVEMARAYATFANGGFRVEPYFIAAIHDAAGTELFKAAPAVACLECESALAPDLAPGIAPAAPVGTPPETAPAAVPTTPSGEPLAPRALDARIVYLVDSMMRDVTVRGTAADARALGRNDIAGKTGTTNDETDAWFDGFTPKLVAIAWVGYDQPQSLGRGEVGGRVALPIWMDFMRIALKGVPESQLPRPPGVVNVRIDPATGQLARGGGGSIQEIMQSDRIPGANTDGPRSIDEPDRTPAPDDLF
jgi:penicillin-binding protein 1A